MQNNNRFIHEIIIQTSADNLWNAFTTPEITKLFWFGFTLDSDWKIGSPWKLISSEGKIHAAGKVLEFDRLRRIAITWRDEIRPELTAEGYSQCIFEFESQNAAVKFTFTQSIELPETESKLLALDSKSWPKVIESLKNYLENVSQGG